jgi:hypothetical protein
MRLVICLPAVVLLSACSVVPPQAWTFDPTRPQPKAELAPAEAIALGDRMAQLQLERNEIRVRIAAEPDVWRRQDYYASLHDVGSELSVVERRLATAASAR